MEKSWLSTRPVAWCSPIQAPPSTRRPPLLATFYTVGMLGLLFFWANDALAADLQVTLRNLRQLVIPLTNLLLAMSFVIGIVLIWKGVKGLKKFGMASSQGSQQGEAMGPIVSLIVGTVLMWLPTTSNVLSDTFFGDNGFGQNLFGQNQSYDYSRLGAGSQLIGYSSSGSMQAQWAAISDTLVLYIQFIGLISFIRGWMIVSKAGAPGAQQGSIAKGITHIVGGVISINFVQFITLVKETLGM